MAERSTDTNGTKERWEAENAELVRRHHSGDVRAFPALYARHETRLRAHLASSLGNLDDVDDLAQTVALKMFTALDRYEASGAPFGAWVHRIAQNAIRDHERRGGRTAPTAPDEIDDRIDASADALELNANKVGELGRAARRDCGPMPGAAEDPRSLVRLRPERSRSRRPHASIGVRYR